jgi:hypothetical protein
VSVKVSVKGLLGSFEDEMAIGTAVNMARNNSSDAGRKTTFEVFTDQTDGLSARHDSPQNTFPHQISEHESLQSADTHRFQDYPTKSTTYEKERVIEVQNCGSMWEVFSALFHFSIATLEEAA